MAGDDIGLQSSCLPLENPGIFLLEVYEPWIRIEGEAILVDSVLIRS